jgi:hypothetical protein
MRRKNWRMINGGIFFIILAVGFFFYMTSFIPRSNDPKGMMEIVGQVSGFVVGISVLLIVVGFIGKKV